MVRMLSFWERLKLGAVKVLDMPADSTVTVEVDGVFYSVSNKKTGEPLRVKCVLLAYLRGRCSEPKTAKCASCIWNWIAEHFAENAP